jgi:tRNA A-37 threonylcarbamoyl transferase component Bud32
MVKLSTIVNIANNAKTNEQRNAVGTELKKLLRGAKGCDPKSQMYAPRMNSLTMIEKGRLLKLGQGQYGAVYYGCLDDKCKTKVAIKFTTEPSAKMEYRIAEKLKGMGVPRMYHFKTCDKRDVLYFEYIDGVPLEKWIRSNPGISEYKSVIRQVISNLYKIHQKYPEFRHHDLHWNNVMITKNGKPIMIDFGLAVMKGIKNPDVNAGDFLTSGISRKSHPIYDAHYFLNIVQTYTHSKIIREFIRDLFKYPNDYLVRNSSYVSDMRLRLVKHKELPTFESILSHPFLTGKKRDVVKKILNAVTKTKKNFVPRAVVAPKPKVVPGETAIERAKRILAEAADKKRAPIRRPGIVAKRKPSVKSQVRAIEQKMKTPTPKVPVYKFTNVKGKERVYKKKGWYEKALAKNRAARAAKNNDETLASLMKKLKVRS